MEVAHSTGYTVSNKREWAAYVDADYSKPPEMMSAREYARASDKKRAAWNRLRRLHHHRFGPIETPSFKRAVDVIAETVTHNMGILQPGPRKGKFLDGPAGVGKTTALLEAGKDIEETLRDMYPAPLTEYDAEYVPVAVVSLPASTTPKALSRRLCNFYGHSVPTRTDKETMTDILVDQAKRSCTALFLVDEIHFVEGRLRDDRDVLDHFKDLSNRIPATFVFAGIEVKDRGIFDEGEHPSNEGRLAQMVRRFGRVPIGPFKYQTAAQRQEFKSLLQAMEEQLVLFNAKPGMLTDLADYLFARTGGFLTSLDPLIKQAANLATTDDPADVKHKERISEELLDTIQLDFDADRRWLEKTGRAPRSRRRTQQPPANPDAPTMDDVKETRRRRRGKKAA